MGAHTKCLAGTMRMSKGTQPTEFKCSTCLDLEKNIAERPARSSNASIAGAEGNVNSSFYVKKIGPEIPALPDTQAPIFSDDDDYDTSSTSNSSNITVIASQLQTKATSETPPPNIEPSMSAALVLFRQPYYLGWNLPATPNFTLAELMLVKTTDLQGLKI